VFTAQILFRRAGTADQSGGGNVSSGKRRRLGEWQVLLQISEDVSQLTRRTVHTHCGKFYVSLEDGSALKWTYLSRLCPRELTVHPAGGGAVAKLSWYLGQVQKQEDRRAAVRAVEEAEEAITREDAIREDARREEAVAEGRGERAVPLLASPLCTGSGTSPDELSGGSVGAGRIRGGGRIRGAGRISGGGGHTAAVFAPAAGGGLLLRGLLLLLVLIVASRRVRGVGEGMGIVGSMGSVGSVGSMGSMGSVGSVGSSLGTTAAEGEGRRNGRGAVGEEEEGEEEEGEEEGGIEKGGKARKRKRKRKSGTAQRYARNPVAITVGSDSSSSGSGSGGSSGSGDGTDRPLQGKANRLLRLQGVALVIGNSDYLADGADLSNPLHDATDMHRMLQANGFDSDLLIDGTKAEMTERLLRFDDRIGAASRRGASRRGQDGGGGEGGGGGGDGGCGGDGKGGGGGDESCEDGEEQDGGDENGVLAILYYAGHGVQVLLIECAMCRLYYEKTIL
jgi:hypothetical protein